MVGTTDDPRPQFAAALDQIERHVDAIEPEDLGRSTPCDAYDVQRLLAHLVAVLRKLTVVKHGGDSTRVADPAVDLSDDGGAAFRRARADLEQTWSDPGLDADYTMAWGTMTGRELFDAYAHEFTVHAWDLAQAVDREIELDPLLAEAALDWYSRNVGAQDRGAGGPFGQPVAVSDDADAYTRLAAYVGRSV